MNSRRRKIAHPNEIGRSSHHMGQEIMKNKANFHKNTEFRIQNIVRKKCSPLVVLMKNWAR